MSGECVQMPLFGSNRERPNWNDVGKGAKLVPYVRECVHDCCYWRNKRCSVNCGWPSGFNGRGEMDGKCRTHRIEWVWE